MALCICPRCDEEFGGLSHFDAHLPKMLTPAQEKRRKGRQLPCMTPEEIAAPKPKGLGLVRDDKGRWRAPAPEGETFFSKMRRAREEDKASDDEDPVAAEEEVWDEDEPDGLLEDEDDAWEEDDDWEE